MRNYYIFREGVMHSYFTGHFVRKNRTWRSLDKSSSENAIFSYYGTVSPVPVFTKRKDILQPIPQAAILQDSKPRDWMLKWSYRSKNCDVPQQHEFESDHTTLTSYPAAFTFTFDVLLLSVKRPSEPKLSWCHKRNSSRELVEQICFHIKCVCIQVLSGQVLSGLFPVNKLVIVTRPAH